MRLIPLLLVIFMASEALALTGVSPSSYSIEFEPFTIHKFDFDFIFDKDISAEIYVEGDLSNYVTLDKSRIQGSEKVVATLTLPGEVEVPGTHYLFIGARQEKGGDSGVNLLSNLRGIIKVEVPYGGKYVELELTAYDANVGEIELMKLEATNKGNETMNISPKIQVFKGSEMIESIELNETFLLPRQMEVYSIELNTSGYEPGNYSVVAITSYGEDRLSRGDDSFRLGYFKIDIVNNTKSLVGGGVEPFFIEVESQYNGFIENVYAKVNLVDLDIEGFSTPAIKLKPFGRGRLEGFFDTSSFEEGEFNVEIVLHYGVDEESSLARLFLNRDQSYLGYLIIAGMVLFIVLVLFLFFRLIRRMRA